MRAHASCASRNAGALVSMSDGMFGRRPPGLGSGKFVRPCDRRHRTYASAWSPVALLVPVFAADPHPAKARMAPIAPSARSRALLPRFTAHVVRVDSQHGRHG